MAIIVEYSYNLSQIVSVPIEKLDKRQAQLETTTISFNVGGVPTTFFELQSNGNVRIGAIAEQQVIPLSDILDARRRLDVWILFIQQELSLSEAPTVKTKQELNVVSAGGDVDCLAAVFTPGIKKLTDMKWEKATDLTIWQPRSEVITEWANFIHWQRFLKYTFDFVNTYKT